MNALYTVDKTIPEPARSLAIPWRIALVILSFNLSGCPSTSPTPLNVIRDYHKAVGEGRQQEANMLVSKESPSVHPDTVSSLPPLGEAHLFWDFQTTNGIITLEATAHTQRISSGVQRYFDQSTPSHTLHSFGAALRHQRADFLVLLVPADQGPIHEKEMEEFIHHADFQALLKNWSGIGPERIDHALREHSTHHAVVQSGNHCFWLVHEPTGWKVKDVQEKQCP